jgi:membrane-associated protease RseP (regulator of RpoE activity)
MRSIAALAALLGFAAGAFAQDDRDGTKKKILEEVEKRLKLEEEKLLKDLERVIDEELKGAKKPQDPPAPPRKPRGYIGLRPADLTAEERKDLGIKGGIKVFETVPDGPAAKAGIKADDVVLSIDGKGLESPQDLPGLIQAAGGGATIKVEILRDGKKQTIPVVLAVHPDDKGAQAPPKDDPKAGDLRERVKKFLQKEEAPKAEAPKPAPPPADDGGFALDDELFEQMRPLLEQFGMDPEQYFEKGKDGKWRFGSDLREVLKDFNLDKLRDLLEGSPLAPKKPAPAPAPAPKAEAPKPPPPPRVEAPKAPEIPAPKAWVGFYPEELSDEQRSVIDVPDGAGMLVAEVIAGGPAEKAGLKKHDVLVKIDGLLVRGEAGLAALLSKAEVGKEMTLTVLRKGKELTLKATPVERKK